MQSGKLHPPNTGSHTSIYCSQSVRFVTGTLPLASTVLTPEISRISISFSRRQERRHKAISGSRNRSARKASPFIGSRHSSKNSRPKQVFVQPAKHQDRMRISWAIGRAGENETYGLPKSWLLIVGTRRFKASLRRFAMLYPRVRKTSSWSRRKIRRPVVRWFMSSSRAGSLSLTNIEKPLSRHLRLKSRFALPGTSLKNGSPNSSCELSRGCSDLRNAIKNFAKPCFAHLTLCRPDRLTD